MLNHIHSGFECNNAEEYAKFINQIFAGIEQYYLNIGDKKRISGSFFPSKIYISDGEGPGPLFKRQTLKPTNQPTQEMHKTRSDLSLSKVGVGRRGS